MLEILTDDNKPSKSRCFPWRQIKQENARFQKESMSVLNHVSSLDHWAYTHLKMDLLSETLDLGFNKISDHIYEQTKNHRIYLGEERKIPYNLISIVFNFLIIK